MPRWIWESPDWTVRFRWDDTRCLVKLAEVRRAQGALLGRVSALGLGLDLRAATLEAAKRSDGEITSWMLWFLGCTHRAITRAERTLDGVFARARLWQQLGQTPLNERQLKAVRRMAESGPGGFDGGMTNREYSAITRTSRATAQRDLAELVALGVLEPVGAGRSASYGLRWPATAG